VNFEKGKVSTIAYEDILASVAPNLPPQESSKLSKQSPEFNKYFLSKSNYSKLLNIALGNLKQRIFLNIFFYRKYSIG